VAEFPLGTVSLLFTDVEGSTQLQHRLGEGYRDVVADHRRLLEAAIEANGGRVVDRQTESFFAVFSRMRAAAAAAAAAQRALAEHEWPEGIQVKVRMGIHAGEPELEGDRYVGLAVSRAARVAAAAHGGQVLLSAAARGLLADGAFRVRPLGSFPLKDFDAPEPLFQLQVDGLPERFPRPRVAPKRSRRRPVLLAVAALLAAGVAAVLAIVLTSKSGGGGLTSVQPNNVGVINPKTNEIVAEVPVGIRPGPIAVEDGSVWVGNLDDRTLTRIDAGRRATSGTIALDSQTPTGLAVGLGGLWVAHGLLGKLSRVDRQFARVTQTATLAGPSTSGAVAVGLGNVWAVYGESTLAKVDPASLRLLGPGFAGSGPSAIVVAGGAVWVANSGDQTVYRFNPGTFAEGAVRTISVGSTPMGIVFGGGALWVANEGDGTVTRIDPGTYATSTIDVGGKPAGIAFGARAVWVASSAGTVFRIDPQTRRVTHTIEVGNAPAGIAFGGGLVWVTVQAS